MKNPFKHKIPPYQRMFRLGDEAIDEFSDKIEEILTEAGVERQNRLRVRLSMEETLLRMRDHYPDYKLKASVARRWSHVIIQAEVEGPPYNPLSEEEHELEDLCSSLLSSIGLNPQYQFDGNVNSLRIQVPLGGINPVLQIFIALLGGILFGMLGKLVFPDAGLEAFSGKAMEFLFGLWSRTLNLVSGPMIFFAVITTILNTGRIAARGGSSWGIITRYFLFSIQVAAFAMVVSTFFYHLPRTSAVIDEKQAVTFLEGILDIVPNDIFDPFLEANTPQLLLVAFVMGACLNALGAQTKNLARVIRQVNILCLQLAEWISRIVPFATFVLITLEVWQGQTRILLSMWQCALLAFLVSLVCIAAVFLIVSRKETVSVKKLLHKVWEPFRITITAGNLDASYGQAELSCTRDLGFSRGFTSISLPSGLVFYMPISVVGTVIFMMSVAVKFNVSASIPWYVTAIISSVTLFIATPPVPGVNLLAYVAVFNQLGIPGDALIDAMVFDILFGFFANAANQMMLQMDLVLQAGKMGVLDREVLKS